MLIHASEGTFRGKHLRCRLLRRGALRREFTKMERVFPSSVWQLQKSRRKGERER